MKYAVENHHSSAILVRTPDSDTSSILLYYAAEVNATIIFDTGHDNQRRLLEEYCEALLSLHAFSHCDTMSAFLCTLVRLNQSRHWRNSHAFSKV